MRTMPFLFVTLVFQMVAFTPALGEEADDRELVMFYCSRCHAADEYHLSERSEKAWGLTVERMQSYYYTDEAFNDEQAKRMVKYLAAHPYSYETYKPQPQPSADSVGEKGPAVKEVPPVSTSGEFANLPPTPAELAAKAKLTAMKDLSAKATGPAKIMGYIATAALALMVITGLMRHKIGRVFLKVHGVLAFVFCGSLTVHAVVFLAEYGAPSVLWLWFGIIATVILLSSEFTGLLHLQNRKLFVKFHTIAGVAGLILTSAHWVWIYI